MDCLECKVRLVKTTSGYVCSRCGLVHSQTFLEEKAAWERTYPLAPIPQTKFFPHRKLHEVQPRVLSLKYSHISLRLLRSYDKALIRADQVFRWVVYNFHLPEWLLWEARRLFSKLWKNAWRGKSIEATASAILYYLLRKERFGVSTSEFARRIGIKRKKLLKLYRLIVRRFGRISPPTWREYVPRLQGYFPDIKWDKVENLIKIFKKGMKHLGKDPRGYLGAAIYIASKGEITQRDISKALSITEVTIRNRVKEFRELGVEVKIKWRRGRKRSFRS